MEQLFFFFSNQEYRKDGKGEINEKRDTLCSVVTNIDE